MFTITTHTVPEINKPIRLSDYCVSIFDKYIPSRKGIKKAFKRGAFYLDGELAKSGDWAKEGQQIVLKDLELTPPKPYEMDLEIVFEDEYFAIVNKPAGISVSGNQFNTIQNVIVDLIKLSTQKDALKWARPVHRLDNQTSGLLVIAKTASAIINLSKQFEKREVKKTYRAIVMGMPNEIGEIDFPIDKLESKTSYKTIETFDSLQSSKLSLLELSPQTGRTHQLRIHCNESGFQILGDKLHSNKENILLHKGLFLAAIELKLAHPKTNEEMVFKIKQPSKFDSLIEREKRRWGKFNSQD